MSRARVRGLALFRTILFLPQVIAMVVVAVMWRMIYDPDERALNQVPAARSGSAGCRRLARRLLRSRCRRSG